MLNFPPMSCFIPLCRIPLSRTAVARAALVVCLGAGSVVHAETALPALGLPNPMPAPDRMVWLPVTQERIETAVAALDALGASMLERSGIPGLAIAVVHKGETIYARGFGKRAANGDADVDADTVFLLASLSKPVGATVVAGQVGTGRIAWDTPLRAHLPRFDMGDPWVSAQVTIGDLYAHRSGLPDHAGDDLEDLGYDRKTVLERLALLPKHPFRAHYAYTNFGLTAAAEAVAAAAGTDWASLSEETLYAPLGMTSTSSRHADYMARDNRASSHMIDGDGYALTDLRQPDAQSPAGGVSSSVNDMARWMAMVLAGGEANGRQVVNAKALLAATSPQVISGAPGTVDARAGTYGFGFGVGMRPSGRVTISHSGAFALGASTNFVLVPDLELGIVVLTNAAPSGVAEAVTASFLDRVELGIETRDWLAGYGPRLKALSRPFGSLVGVKKPADPAPAQQAEAYVGRYDNAYFGPATVEEADGGLVLRLGSGQAPLAMQHWDGDSFIVQPMSENQPQGSVSRVDFSRTAPASAASVTIEHLDENGLGTFERPR